MPLFNCYQKQLVYRSYNKTMMGNVFRQVTCNGQQIQATNMLHCTTKKYIMNKVTILAKIKYNTMFSQFKGHPYRTVDNSMVRNCANLQFLILRL